MNTEHLINAGVFNEEQVGHLDNLAKQKRERVQAQYDAIKAEGERLLAETSK
jgi:hypothetical protein